VSSDGILVEPTQPQYRLGEPTLPVAPYRAYIDAKIQDNPAVVIKGETGSGKSSQLGLYLLEAGYGRIFIAQPRILAARDLMEWARQNLGPDYSRLAGYLTGTAADSDCGPDARLIYVTEELLFKKLNRNGLYSGDVVMLDEAHERTTPGGVLFGLAKALIRDNPAVKLVISSATIDTDRNARLLADAQTGQPAPVLDLPGRTHPITDVETDKTVADTTKEYMGKGHNVLTFEAGTRRMWSTQGSARKPGETVHVLYGDQSPSDQKVALDSADHHHIIATRVAETSITPQGKDTVVDSGISKIGKYEAGKRILFTKFSSRGTMWQRRGRVGRTKPGIYVQAQPADAPPSPRWEDRDEYEPPEIQNTSVAKYIMELLATGRRLEDLELPDPPVPENLAHDYKVLRRLGATALTDSGELVLTDVGRAMNDLPLDVQLARMLVEARAIESSDELNRDDLRLQVAAAAAVQQVNGILNAGESSGQRYLRRKSHQGTLSKEQASDVIFELEVFEHLRGMQKKIFASRTQGASEEVLAKRLVEAEEQFEQYLFRSDIKINRYYKAVRTFDELCLREGLNPDNLRKPNAEERKLIIACQITGAEEVFVQRGRLAHQDIRGDRGRTLGKRSTIVPAMAHLLIGTAFDLSDLRSSGRFVKRFIVGGSVVTLDQLRQYAPHRLSNQSLGHGVSPNGVFVERRAYYFDGELQVGSAHETPSPTLETRVALIRAMMTGSAPNAQNPQQNLPYRSGTPRAAEAVQRWKEALELEHKSPAKLNVLQRYDSLINKTIRESLKAIPLDVTDPAALDVIIPSVYKTVLVRPTRRKDIPDILLRAPDAVTVHIDEETKQYLPVTYKSGVAYVTVPRDKKFIIKREDFVELAKYHDVKIRVAAGKYQQMETQFTLIDEQRPAEAAKQERKAERNAREATAEAEGRGKATRKKDRDVGEQRRRTEVIRALAAVTVLPRSRGSRHLQISEAGA
jgi:hypothetical protein